MNYICLLCSTLLDWILGDPHWMPHPVRWMGRMIGGLEQYLRNLFPKTPQGELAAGGLLAMLVVLTFWGGSAALLYLLGRISPWLMIPVQIWLGYQLLAARALEQESKAVCPFLNSGDLAGARQAVSMIVGRDTTVLDEEGVTKAAVETVAENTSDGVLAPLFWMLIGGVPFGMAYKAVNTLDSMVGYRNERYLYFGRISARLDDVLNWIPARLSGILMCLSACLLPGFQGENAFRIFFRDRKKHASPNSAHTEAACAGALGVQLAGDAIYGGKVVKKQFIGDPLRPISLADVGRAACLMYVSEILCLLIAGVFYYFR